MVGGDFINNFTIGAVEATTSVGGIKRKMDEQPVDEAILAKKTATHQFFTALDQFNDELRNRFLAFLLFDPREPVHLEDLAAIWQCEITEAAESCDHFENNAMVSRTVEKDWSCGQLIKYSFHQLCHELTVAQVTKELSANDEPTEIALSKVRTQVIINISALMTDDESDERLIARFINKLLLLNKEKLLKTIFSKIKTTDFLDSTAQMGDDVVVSENGTTGLMVAAETGHLKLVEVFYRANPGVVHLVNRHGDTALMKASENGHLTVVKFLAAIAPNSVAQANKDSSTPIIWASKRQFWEMVTFLAEKSPNSASLADKHGDTPIMEAAKNGKLDVVKLLAEKAPDSLTHVDRFGDTPIIEACKSGKLDVVSFLAEKAPSTIAQTDYYGNTPMIWASRNQQWEVVKLLANMTPNSSCQANCDGNTPMMFACRRGNLDVVKILAEMAPSSVSRCNNVGDTPVTASFKNGHFDVTKFLAEKFPNCLPTVNKAERRTRTVHAF